MFNDDFCGLDGFSNSELLVLKLTSENAELERQVSMGLQTQSELVEEVSNIEPL